MRIISRAESGLVPARSRVYIDTPTAELWLHHSAGALDAGGNGVWWDDVQGIQRFHMAPKPQGRGWTDIAYSFLVGGGQIFEGRGVGVAGGHTAGRNRVSHAICLIGDYSWMVPKQEDLEAIAWLTAHGKAQGWWGDLTGPHRDAPGASTACCGVNLIACIPDLRRMAASPQEDDMTPEQAKKLDQVHAALVGDKSALKQVLDSARLNGPTHARILAAVQAASDPATLAEEIARRLPGTTGPVRVEDLKRALVEVFGALDDSAG